MSSMQLDLDAFLNHKSGAGGGGKYLDWKTEGHLRLWLHPKSAFYAIWANRWATVVETEDPKTKKKEKKVFGRKFNSHERELILKKQNYRKPDGTREFPPVLCPMSLMIEHVFQQVNTGKLSWTDPVFEFEGDDPTSEYNLTILAGGMYGAFNGDDLSKDELKELKLAHVDRKTAFHQDLRAKLSYMFIGIADPKDGVRIAFETKAVGDKMKKAMRDKITRVGRDKGDPFKHPYPFDWTYDETQSFDEKYNVVALDDPPEDDVLEQFKEPLPDVSQQTELGDCLWLYKSMKQHAVIELPWEQIFGPAEKAGLMKEDPKKNVDSDGIPNIGPGDDDEPALAGAAVVAKAAGKVELFECDHCKAVTLTNESDSCSACGTTFNVETTEMTARPCECKALVTISSDGTGRSICTKCGTIFNNADWSIFRKAEPKIEEVPEAPRRRVAAKEAAKAGDGIPWKT